VNSTFEVTAPSKAEADIAETEPSKVLRTEPLMPEDVPGYTPRAHFLPGMPGDLRNASPGLWNIYYEGSRAIYAALSADAGDYSGVLHEGRFRYSIALATGANCRPEELGIDLDGPAKVALTRVVSTVPLASQSLGQNTTPGVVVSDAGRNPGSKNPSGEPFTVPMNSVVPSLVTPPTGVSDGGATVNAMPPSGGSAGSSGFSFAKRPRKPKAPPLPYLTAAQINDLDRALLESQARGASAVEQQELIEAFKAIAALQGEVDPVKIFDGGVAQHFMGLINPDVRLTASGELARTAEKHFSAVNKRARPEAITFAAMAGGSQAAGAMTASSAISQAVLATAPTLLAKIIGTAEKQRPVGASNSPVHTDPKPLSQVHSQGIAYPLYSTGDSAKLSPGTGMIFVLEGPDQRKLPGNPSPAAQFEAATTGAFSDIATGKRAVPALRYTNDVTYGHSVKRFDGFDDTHVMTLKDAKYNFDSMKAGRKSNLDMQRAMKALQDNLGILGVLELQNSAQARRLDKKIDTEVGRSRPPNMSIRGR
jgi:hypothetical protein